jgi:hypothetical protein
MAVSVGAAPKAIATPSIEATITKDLTLFMPASTEEICRMIPQPTAPSHIKSMSVESEAIRSS